MATSPQPLPLPQCEISVPMVLLDRYVPFVDELVEIIEEMGQPPLSVSVESVIEGLPACSSSQEQEDQEQRAIRAEIQRYQEEVEAPAFAKLQARKASVSSLVRKEPVQFTSDSYDADFYKELLDGVDLRLPPVADPPKVSSLELLVSWPPKHPLHGHAPGAFISSSDRNLLVLYVGPYRPGIPSPGCYLVYDVWANSVAIVPPLPSYCVSFRSHCSIGTGVAILRCSNQYYDYVLLELLFKKDDRSHLTSNKASLFMWWSSGSGPLAGRWIQKDVRLPIRPDSPAEHTTRLSYSFHADMAFTVSRRALCWVDLLKGILVCHDIEMLAHGTTDGGPLFSFIPLPPECVLEEDPGSEYGRGRPEEYRTMCCVHSDTIKFVSMDGYSQGCPIGNVMITTWTLHCPLQEKWEWRKDATTFSIKALWNDPIYKYKLNLQPLRPSFPVYDLKKGKDIIHISITNYECKQERLEPTGFYMLSLDMQSQRVVGDFDFNTPSGKRISMCPWIFGAHYSHYLKMNAIILWDEVQQRRQRRALELESLRRRGKEVLDIGDMKSRPSMWPISEVWIPPGKCNKGSSSSSSGVGLASLLDL